MRLVVAMTGATGAPIGVRLCGWAPSCCPPVLTFYNRPTGIDDLVEHLVARILDQFGLDLPTARRWNGMRRDAADRTAEPDAGTAGPTARPS
ncbi:hypothetical protein [Streptomyces sp. NPDC059122]|uniref:hypothetical protein n=1 Tax=Streptomyces sp. NPDC059122 TaxID=3346732 RepID=UPI0036C2F314